MTHTHLGLAVRAPVGLGTSLLHTGDSCNSMTAAQELSLGGHSSCCCCMLEHVACWSMLHVGACCMLEHVAACFCCCSSMVYPCVWLPLTCPGSARGSHCLGGCSCILFSQRCFSSPAPSNPSLSLRERKGLFTSVTSLRTLPPELLVPGTGLDGGRHSTNTVLNNAPPNPCI